MKYYRLTYAKDGDPNINPGAAATTHGFHIYIKESYRGNRDTLEHEKCHVRQNYLALLVFPVWLFVRLFFPAWLKLHKEAQAFVVAAHRTKPHLLAQGRRQQWVQTLASHTMKHYAFYQNTTLTQRKRVINYHIKKQLKE